MASFQAKIGWKMSRKREYKEYRSNPTRHRKFQKNSKKFRSVPFLPDEKQKIQKNSKKIQKVKKYYYGLISS